MNGYIEIVSGTLGGGKTSLGVEFSYATLKKGGWVFSNVEFYPDKIAERMLSEGYVFDPQRLVMLQGDARDFYKVVKRGTADSLVHLLIDEAGLEFNSRDHTKTEKDQIAFNTMARKLDIRLTYVSQSHNDVDKQIRGKADTVWVCRNMKKLKIWGLIPFPLPFYFRVRYDTTRAQGKLTHMDTDIVLRSPAWGLYNSNAMVGSVAQKFNGMEQVQGSPLKRVPRPKPPRQSFWPELAALACASYFGF